MNIGVLKLGARLTWDSFDKTGGLGEAKAILEMLAIDNTITVYTKILIKENLNPKENIFIKSILDFDKITEDILLIFNGNCNFFGGAEDKEQIRNYSLINNFKGKIYYIWIDPELYPKQIWSSIEKKEWASNYKKEDIEIIKTDINIITSIYNIDSAFEKVNKGKVFIKKENIFYFPFEKYPLLGLRSLRINNSCRYDLLYTGTYRNGRRQDKMIKYYFGHQNIKSTFIGKTKLEDFNKQYLKPEPEFKPAINFKEIKKEINDCIASVNIGDKFYEGNILTPRIYECILYSTVCLIDIDFDPQKRVFTDAILREFNYVSSKQEVEDKIIMLKKKPDFRKNLIELQKLTLFFDNKEYNKQFMDIINRN